MSNVKIYDSSIFQELAEIKMIETILVIEVVALCIGIYLANQS